jgi:hypothetical protein
MAQGVHFSAAPCRIRQPSESRILLICLPVISIVISNEAPGYLITAGHGSENLYQVLQFLAAQPGSGIPADFVTEV